MGVKRGARAMCEGVIQVGLGIGFVAAVAG